MPTARRTSRAPSGARGSSSSPPSTAATPTSPSARSPSPSRSTDREWGDNPAPSEWGRLCPLFSSLEVLSDGYVLVESIVEEVPAAVPVGRQEAAPPTLLAGPGGAGRPHRPGGLPRHHPGRRRRRVAPRRRR